MSRPADHGGHAESAFPVGVLLAAERRGRRVRPGELVRTVVGRVDDDGVVGDAKIVERLQQLADVAVVLDHAVGIFVAGHAALAEHRWRTWVKTCMRVVFIQTKNGLLACTCRFMKSIAAAVVSSSMVSIRLR